MAYNPNQPPQYPQPNPYGQPQPGYQQPPGSQQSNYQQPPGFQQQSSFQQQPNPFPQQPVGFQAQPVVQSQIAQQLGPTSVGLDANLAAAVSYIWIAGLIFFIIEKNNKFVRFHALQAMLLGLAGWVLSGLLFFLPLHFLFYVGDLVGLAWFAAAAYTAWQAYQGIMFKLPVIGDIAQKNVDAWNPGAAPGAGMNPPNVANAGFQQPGYPPQQPGYPPQQPPTQYPPQQGQYPQQPGYPPQQPGYPPQQGQYPPQQGQWPPRQ